VLTEMPQVVSVENVQPEPVRQEVEEVKQPAMKSVRAKALEPV
jgi:hypothetical protein